MTSLQSCHGPIVAWAATSLLHLGGGMMPQLCWRPLAVDSV